MTTSSTETARPVFIRPRKVPDLYGISRSALYRLAQSGEIKIHKRGHSSFVKCDDLDRYITGTDKG